MKTTLTLLLLLTLNFITAQEKEPAKQKKQTVEASCGQCQFGMKEKSGCDLAVRIDGKAYFVEGSSIDDHGDAHAHDGFCQAIRQADVIGEVKNGKFVATYFKVRPKKKK
ncbi:MULTISPECIES: DUF6370 family protein [Flavobacterium]|uniref:DUF6370 family protein n=1 Tax=Flavobacterium jumunjinense TaxID=998845 RepID=A0ABV5GTG1_9FLAO|nr:MULTISPECIES: DUF6370 family protein [Flavobacterium]